MTEIITVLSNLETLFYKCFDSISSKFLGGRHCKFLKRLYPLGHWRSQVF